MIYVGIDPGSTGGLALLAGDGRILELEEMPLEKKGIVGAQISTLLREWWRTYGDMRVTVEKTSTMPKQGISSAHSYGIGAGVIHGILITLGLPWTLVAPRQWASSCHQGIVKGDLTTKQVSLIAAQRIWPGYDWPKTPRSGKVLDGPVDAALIAHWGALHRWQQKIVDTVDDVDKV